MCSSVSINKKSALLTLVNTLSANVLILGLNVGTGILTARFLGAEGRGEMAAMVYWPQLLAYLLTIGLPSALIYRLKTHPQEAKCIIGSVLWVGGLLGIVAIAIGYIIIPVWLNQYSLEIIRLSQYAMLVAPLALLGILLVAVAQAQPTLETFNRARYGSPLIAFCFMLGLMALDALTPTSAVISIFLAGVIVNTLLIIWAWRSFRPQLSGSVRSLYSLFSYGLRAYGVDLLKIFSMHIDRMIVLYFLDAIAMGLYVTALSLAQILNIIPAGISSVLFPRTSGQARDDVLKTIGQAVRVDLILVVTAGLPLFIIGPYMLGILYGDEFIGAAFAFRLLIVYVIISGLALILEQVFMAVGKPGRLSLVQGVAFCIGIPVLAWLVQGCGIEGAGVGLICIAFIRFVLVYTNIRSTLGGAAPSLIPKFGEVKQVFDIIKRHINRKN